MNCDDSTGIRCPGSDPPPAPRCPAPVLSLLFSSPEQKPQICCYPQQRNVLSHDVTKSPATVRSVHTHRCTFWSLVTDLRDKKLKLTAYTSQTPW